MAFYIFKLLVWNEPNGIDNAQGYRAKMLGDLSEPIKYIFTELPTSRDIEYYKKTGIDVNQMLSIHQYFTDSYSLEFSVRVEDKLEELQDSLHYTDIISSDGDIKLIKDGAVAASISRDDMYPDFCRAIYYFSDGCYLVRKENYMGRMPYVDYFVTASSDAGMYAKHVRRSYFNSDGTMAYEQIFSEGEKEWYLFPNGRICTNQEFFAEFIKKLNLTDKDVVLLDRLVQPGFMQSLLQFGNRAKIIAVFHSRHFLEKGEDTDRLYLNDEYYDWFKYSHRINTMVVSTPGQKKELAEKLCEYGCSVPQIEVIPAGGIDKLRYPESKRKPYSLVTVSRLYPSKKTEWIIRSVIKAHETNPRISLDIYGRGAAYAKYLQDLVVENNADSYIRFMGYMDVTEVYKNYEAFVTASLGETLGLSVMEAVGSGTAVIGLNVKYGNQVFVHPGENGYLVDFSHIESDEKQVIADMAEKIVLLFDEKEKLETFHNNSYEIAKDYLCEVVEKKWKNLLKIPINESGKICEIFS